MRSLTTKVAAALAAYLTGRARLIITLADPIDADSPVELCRPSQLPE